jgi:hypothetical protein
LGKCIRCKKKQAPQQAYEIGHRARMTFKTQTLSGWNFANLIMK